MDFKRIRRSETPRGLKRTISRFDGDELVKVKPVKDRRVRQ